MFPTLSLFSAENEKAKERVETPLSRRWAEGGIQLYMYKNQWFYLDHMFILFKFNFTKLENSICAAED